MCLSFGLAGCAGPTTPFGSLNGLGSKVGKLIHSAGLGSDAKISFTPHRQMLHDRTTFDVKIDDPSGVPETYSLRMTYNNIDVTETFLKNAKVSWLGPDRRTMKLSIPDFRLPPTREHDIQLVYQRDMLSFPVVAEFEPPRCSPAPTARKLDSIPKFDPPAITINMINRQARQGKLNPHLVAGLIAQESSFDPSAVSTAKAMGLTQITSIVETEILKDDQQWPRYPGLREMSALEVRLAVADGSINSENEWRLNPEYSIQGGVAYLSYIHDYWNRPERQAQIQQTFVKSDEPLLEIMLASYNSGPARVSRAIERGGAHWLDDQELSEGKKYVRRVVSFCDHFSNGEE